MKKFLSVATLILLPAVAFANNFDALLYDLDNLEQELDRDKVMQEQTNLDLQYEEIQDLFPREPGIAEPHLRDSVVSATNVYIRIEGIPYILQDVPLAEWFAPYVSKMADLGIISGYTDASGRPTGSFGPADDVTLEQLAKIAVESAAIDQTKCPGTPLNETASGSWSAGYIACAEYLQWTPFSDAMVNVKDPASRTDVVVTAMEAFNQEVGTIKGDVFTDVSANFPFAAQIEAAAADEIVSGYKDEEGNLTGEFGPFDSVNRAETAKIFSLAIDTYNAQ